MTTTAGWKPIQEETSSALEKRTEWVAVLHGQNGTIKMAFPNAMSLAQGLAGQTKEGWMVASVYEREAQLYTQAWLDGVED